MLSGVDGGTTLSGTVVAPTDAGAGYGQPDPIPGALVYVPNGTVEPLDADGGVSCDQCADGVSGNPLVSTYTKTRRHLHADQRALWSRSRCPSSFSWASGAGR